MKTIPLILTILLFFLSSCAQPTSYVKRNNYMGNPYGCSEKKISNDEFAIVARGNKYSSAEHVGKLALYHAANVTKNNSKKSFYIVKENIEKIKNYQLTIIPIPIFGAPILFVPVNENMIDEVTSILIIKFCHEATSIESECINAEKTIDQLKIDIEKNTNT